MEVEKKIYFERNRERGRSSRTESVLVRYYRNKEENCPLSAPVKLSVRNLS